MTTQNTNPEGQSGAPSSPAPASEPTTPTEPQAQAAPALSATDVKSMLTEFRDGLFADLRKAGVFGKQTKPTPKPQDGDAVPAATVTQPDPIKLRVLDRALNKAGIAGDLTPSQYERAERAFTAEAPEDAESWVQDFFPGLKARATVNPAPAPATPKPINVTPASDRGAPAAVVPLVEADLVTMSESDRSALIREKGLPWFKGQLAKQLKGRSIRMR